MNKRAQIQEAAARLFLEQGFTKTSMDAIAATAGVSKATLYAHFTSKQLLFESIVQERFRSEVEQNLQISQLGDDPAEGLAAIGRHFLRLLYATPAMGTLRVVLAESARLPELGESFYRSGPSRTLDMVTNYLRHLQGLGRINIEDPAMAADLFLAMLRNKTYLKCLLGMRSAPDNAEIETLVRSAAALCIAAFTSGSPKN